MKNWIELAIGIVLVVVAVSLLIEFVATFAKLILGIIALVAGLWFLQKSRAPSVRVR